MKKLILLGLLSASCWGQKLAITFDDLPLNGELPAGMTHTQIAADVLKILKKRHVPPVYGFINAWKLEGNPDAAQALRLWAVQEPVGNHTYTHMSLADNSVELFERNLEENEPVLELLSMGSSKPGGWDWHWFRYPYLIEGDTMEKRRAVREYLGKRNYKIAQVTMDWHDYLWNFTYTRCLNKKDFKAIEGLRASYLQTAAASIDYDRELAKLAFGHDINHVLLMHLGTYSSTILPDVFDLLKKKGFQLVTLEEAQSDPVYAVDPEVASRGGNSLTGQMLESKKIAFPEGAPDPDKLLAGVCQ